MLLVSEGVLDVGDPNASANQRRGAVRVLVQKVLEEHWGQTIEDWEIETDFLPRVHRLSEKVSGFARKVHLAIVEAKVRDCSCVVIVVDQDGPNHVDRIKLLEAGRVLAENDGYVVPSVVGVAVNMVETWLLSDELAINEALAPTPQATTRGHLEQLYGAKDSSSYPKRVFRTHISTSTLDQAAPYDAVASRIRLDILEQRCPSGFGKFAKAIRERCE